MTKKKLEREIMRGLDDLAHNRLWTGVLEGKRKKVKNYGKRNKKYPCYCKLIGSWRKTR